MIKKVIFFFKSFPLLIVILVFIFSGFCASMAAALVRLTSQDMHPFQIAFFRSFLVIPMVVPIIYKNSFSIIKTTKPVFTLFRSLSGSGAMLLFFYGISLTELSKAQSLAFTIPIFATLLAIIAFKEVVGIRRWGAMGFGFFGVLIVLRPDLEISIGPVCVLIACVLWSISLLIAKIIILKLFFLNILKLVFDQPLWFLLLFRNPSSLKKVDMSPLLLFLLTDLSGVFTTTLAMKIFCVLPVEKT